MSKPICLVFALLILTTILCNNSVCSQRGSWKQSAVCGCKISPNKGLQCTRRHIPKTGHELNEMLKCICRNSKKHSKSSQKEFVKICNTRYPSIPL